VLYQRVVAIGTIAMPPLLKSRVDDPAVNVLGAWIARVPQNYPQGGLTYEYYKQSIDFLSQFNFQNPTSTGQIATFDLAAARDVDGFVMRYTGLLQVDTAGSYTFYTSSDDGSQLLVDGALVVDNDGHHGNQERSGTVTLSPGYHTIVVTYFQAAGGLSLEADWSGPGIAKQVIPANRLFLTVPTPIVNSPPTLSVPMGVNSDTGQSVSIAVTASDPDGNSLHYEASGLPDGLSMDPDTGLITGAARPGTAGGHKVTVGVSDGPAVASASFSWLVINNECTDGIDNDGDGLIDAADPGCANGSHVEAPPCNDGIDNDGDGKIDFDGGAVANHGVPLGQPDPQCNGHAWANESASACGLGMEVALLLPAIEAARRWRRRRQSVRASR
jgi:hypothetical protein